MSHQDNTVPQSKTPEDATHGQPAPGFTDISDSQMHDALAPRMGLEGQTLGEFEIIARIGQGGMGAVYKARQTSLDRFVALKTLRATLAGDAAFIARFRREAKAAAALNHTNLVQVHAAGETDGLHWFAMEFVEGESAQARLKRKERLDPAEAVAIGIHVATALEYGWRKAHLIHRDIKPDNIFLSTDGEVKLGDLGLAKNAGENQSLTMTGASMGTPYYISPEQGQGKKDVDLRADIYSLGCTLFHLVAGRTPYSGDTAMAVMLKHVTEPVPNPQEAWPAFPAELAHVVTKMMAKDPATRQQDYAEVIADLRRAYDALTGVTIVPKKIAVTRPPQQFQPAAHARVPEAVATGSPRGKFKTLLIAVLLAVSAFFVFKRLSDPTGFFKLNDTTHVGVGVMDIGLLVHKATVRETSGARNEKVFAADKQLPVINDWRDLTERVREKARAFPNLVIEPGSVRHSGNGDQVSIPLTSPGVSDYAVRLRFVGDGQITLRTRLDGSLYVLCQRNQTIFHHYEIGAGAPTLLRPNVPHLSNYDASQPHDLLVTMLGPTLRVWLDDHFVGEANDPKFQEGDAKLVFTKSSVVNRVEVAEDIKSVAKP